MDKPDQYKRPSLTKAELTERLASVLAILDSLTDEEIEALQARGIPYEVRKTLTAEQILSVWQFDHGIHHAINGPHRHWNYTPRRILGHRWKTHNVDRPQIAKTKRITAEQEAFQARILAKSGQAEEPPERKAKPKAKIQSRGFAKGGPKQKIKSRGFQKRTRQCAE